MQTRPCKCSKSFPTKFENQLLSELGGVLRSPQQLRYVRLLYLPDLLYARVVRLLNMHWPANCSVKFKVSAHPMLNAWRDDGRLTDCDDLPTVRKQPPII